MVGLVLQDGAEGLLGAHRVVELDLDKAQVEVRHPVFGVRLQVALIALLGALPARELFAHVAQFEPAGHEGGVELEGSFVVFGGFLLQVLGPTAVAPVAVRFGVVGVELNRFVVAGQRFVKSFEFLQRVAPVRPGRGVGGVDLNGAGDDGFGPDRVARLGQDDAAEVQCVEVLGVELQHLLVDRLGLGQLALLVQVKAVLKQLVQVGQHHPGLRAQGSAQQGLCGGDGPYLGGWRGRAGFRAGFGASLRRRGRGLDSHAAFIHGNELNKWNQIALQYTTKIYQINFNSVCHMSQHPLRPIAFVLASTHHGSMLVNRHDYRLVGQGGYGVGHQLLNTSAFDAPEVDFALQLLAARRQHFGDGVVALDCGANVGVHTLEWARLMQDWGKVIAVEAQERIFYALAGNLALNNCFNARAIWAAMGAQTGEIGVPVPNYFAPSSFGSLEIRQTAHTEFIGQNINYEQLQPTAMLSIDNMGLDRLDFIKIDIEGMEMDALKGGVATIERLHPLMMIEKIKSDESAIGAFLRARGYQLFELGINLLAVHESDPIKAQIRVQTLA